MTGPFFDTGVALKLVIEEPLSPVVRGFVTKRRVPVPFRRHELNPPGRRVLEDSGLPHPSALPLARAGSISPFMSEPRNTDVLIIGAGPVGLALAAECHRHGVSFRIIDENPTHSVHSKALAIWSNTLEHLAALGVADRFLNAGIAVRHGVFEDNGRRVAEIPLNEGLDSPYPQPIILPQSETEALLLAHLAEHGVSVERSTRCVAVRPGDQDVEVDVSRGAETGTLRARWVAGCDGARSVVRHHLPVEFPGVTESMGFILADARVSGELPADGMLISSGPGGNVIIFPVKDGVWRIFALRENGDDHSEPTLEEIQSHLDGAGLGRIHLHDPEWLSHFVVNERVASRNRVGRVFLLGDASHIHSPAGGQGMNTGLQDAFNLGWKLKLLCDGQGDPENLAESYFSERHPVALQVVKETSNLLHFGVHSHAFIRAAKRIILPLLAHLEPVKKNAAFHLSELGISYPPGPLIEEDTAAFGHVADLAPGTLARDVEVMEQGAPVSLWRKCLHPGYTLLIFSGCHPDHDAIDRLSAASGPARTLVVWHGGTAATGLLDPGGGAHHRYGVRSTAWYLIRPDQYIAARGSAADSEVLERHFNRIR